MIKFAFLTTPRIIEEIRRYYPLLKLLPRRILSAAFHFFPNLKVFELKSLRSSRGAQIAGYLIVQPLACQSSGRLITETDSKLILSAGFLAKRLEVSLLGIDGFVAAVTANGYSLQRQLNIPLTTGAAYTSWSVVEAVYSAARKQNIDLEKTPVAILGLAHPVAKLCAQRLSDYCKKLLLVDPDNRLLEGLKESILGMNSTQVLTDNSPEAAISQAKIIIKIGYNPQSDFDLSSLYPHCLVCDINIGKIFIRVDKNPLTEGIKIIKAGIIKVPFELDLCTTSEKQRDLVPSALAETMLLCFSGRPQSYSLGDTINIDKMEEIADLAVQHGFEVWLP